jgi:hypothetical protein
MVRRRVVLAVSGSVATAPDIRAALEPAAARLGMDLADLPGTVLEAGDLLDSLPDLTLALPEGRTVADGRALVDACARTAAIPAESVHLDTVLVHDLAFRVPTTDADATVAAIDAEGILSDTLGAYEAVPGKTQLVVDYTGPLLSDRSVGAVRVGIARAAGTDPSAVEVFPRTPTGAGVQLHSAGALPEESGVGAHQVGRGHGGGHAAEAALTSLADGDSTRASALFLPVAGGLGVAWIALLVLLARRRSGASRDAEGRDRPAE